jgi:basic membrane protein A
MCTNKLLRLVILALFLAAIVIFSGCGGTVPPVNHSPIIITLTADPPSPIEANQSTVITCFAVDQDNDQLIYSWAKTGGTITGTGSAITWTAPATAGTYTITCAVSDGELSDSQAISIVVTEPENQPPVITSTAITSATVGEAYTYTVEAIDPDGDTLTYSLLAAPADMAIVATIGVISWTPTAAGTFSVTVNVSDGELSDSQSFTLTVSPASVDSSIKVGIVFDIGGLGDKSFNDSAYRGIEWAETDFNIEHTELEPEEGGDLEVSLRNLAMMDHDLIIGVGFLFTDAISTVADEFPNTKFAIVDGNIPDKSNVVSLLFKENEGSFLVGMIAGLKAKDDSKDTVGFLGGMDIPVIHKFEAGYIAGVHYVYPECEILSSYVGSFIDPAQGRESALSQYDDGAWVIFHASGRSGEGVFEAGIERKRYVIGVDSNQNYMGYIEETGENFGLTSMLKQVDLSVYLTIKSVIEGTFVGGTEIFDLNKTATIGGKEYYGVYYALDEYNEDLITSEMIAQVEEARDKIISGEIIVPEEI